jgi:hypothetical protein
MPHIPLFYEEPTAFSAKKKLTHSVAMAITDPKSDPIIDLIVDPKIDHI